MLKTQNSGGKPDVRESQERGHTRAEAEESHKASVREHPAVSAEERPRAGTRGSTRVRLGGRERGGDSRQYSNEVLAEGGHRTPRGCRAGARGE